MRPGAAAFDLSVAGRMIFSCLVDADYRDTEAFHARLDGLDRDRDWPALGALLTEWRARFGAHMGSFRADSDLNRLRADILAHVRSTRSQSTVCHWRCTLSRSCRGGGRRHGRSGSLSRHDAWREDSRKRRTARDFRPQRQRSTRCGIAQAS